MKTQNKYIIVAVVAVIVGLIAGYALFHSKPSFRAGATSATGTTNSTQRASQIVLSGNGVYDSVANQYVYTSSTTPLCNNDATDRTIKRVDYTYPAIATMSTSTANYIIQMATSSSNTQLIGNTNYIVNSVVSTTTGAYVSAASSTVGAAGTSGIIRLWPAGSCIAFQGNATTSSQIVVQVEYLSQ